MPDFNAWWNTYKLKIPPTDRKIARKWILLGWNTHATCVKEEEQEAIEHTKKMVEEYQAKGCPPGWWGDPD